MSRILGIDSGSVSVKLVFLDEKGDIIKTLYRRHHGHPLETLLEMLESAGEEGRSAPAAITGATGKLIAESMGLNHINELIALSTSVSRLYPSVRTIMEMGGEDSKLLILEGSSIKDFSLNSVCAAGTGSFLDQQAERLLLSIEEFSSLALKSSKPPHIAGRCSVFAKSDMIHLQQIATPVEDIVAGLCFAVARNFKGSIVKGRKLPLDVAFMGGVALNRGVVRAFREVFELEGLIIPEHTAMMGAIGVALKAAEDGLLRPIDLDSLRRALPRQTHSQGVRKPLIQDNDGFMERHILPFRDMREQPLAASSGQRVRCFLGIDIGSISTNLALLDEEGRLIAKRYLMTSGRPIEAVRRGLREIGDIVGESVEICGVGTTGSGRYMIADFVGADIVKNEITAQATAAAFIDPEVDTIFEIGGQDSKYISLKDGVIVDFEMNKACAAGTGSFLEEQAEKLSISVKGEFAECAFSSCSPCSLGERCTVFMENSLMSQLQRGARKNDLLAGLAYSIVENYINRVVAGRRIGEKIFFQGGTAFNKAVVAAFEKYLNKTITVPPHHDVTGAIGMALIVRDYMKANPERRTTFKGFDLADRAYHQSSFECRGCENMCEINRVKIEGEDGYLFYGGRCERYDIRRKKKGLPDLFKFRDEQLWKSHQIYSERFRQSGEGARYGRIGLPYVFFFHDYLPYWSTLLWELGFEVVPSPVTNRRVINLGVEVVLAETCFPVKVGYGHVRYLLEEGVSRIFLPSFTNMCQPDDRYEKGHACPLTQSFPYQVRVAFPEAEVITPVVNLKEGEGYLLRELRRIFSPFGIRAAEIEEAMAKASEAQREFHQAIKERADQVIGSIDRTTIVIVGRAYNAFDRGVNLEIPQKLSTLDVLAIPMDFLPPQDIHDDWPDMYWRSGQRILSAARAIRSNRHLYPIFIGNFCCGPDSFIQKYFEKELGDRAYLHIEIDEHSADAGAITRCEAFLDSVEGQIRSGRTKRVKRFIPKKTGIVISENGRKRTIFVPPMSDHARAISAAFRYCGIPAEVLPETDEEAISLGRRFVSGKECYPCTVTTGDMMKKVLSSDFRPEESAFFMPSGTGPCRFGQYNLFQRMLLDSLGFNNVPIFSPVQDVTLYRDLGIVGSDFVKRSWQGIVAYDLLLKLLHETRPYEKEEGVTDELYRHYLVELERAVESRNGSLESLLRKIKKDFSAIPRVKDKKPLIGIVGEIFVRSNRFSNEDLVRKIEALGGEAWLSPVDEWIYYINYMSLKKAIRRRDYRGALQFFIKRFYQNRLSHRYEHLFRDILKTTPEPDIREVLDRAAPYLHESFEGEAILSIGKAIDMIQRGAQGIINAMPFGCMPGTVVTAIMRGVSEKYNVPSISIPYDGTESSTTQLLLEAFMEQACRKL